MSLADYVILGVLAILVVLAVRYSIRHKGKCSGGCSGCPHSGGCTKSPEKKP